MSTPEDLLYTKEHAWIRLKNNTVVVGITDILQEELDFIDEVDLPKKGDELEMDIECTSFNYNNNTYDLPAPLTGRVTKINPELKYSAELIHSSCYDEGWLFEMEYDEEDELEMLLSAEEYEEEVENMEEFI